MTDALRIDNLVKQYGGNFRALDGISLRVAQGDFFALLGPNGAGKSTTLGIVCGLVTKTTGSVSVFGHDLDRDPVMVKRLLGVVPQEFNFNQFEKIFDILVTQAGFHGIPARLARERAGHYLRQLGLWDKRDVQARMLSGGMKRRLMIARALVHEPKLLILDEPTAGVDIELRRSMWTFLQEINAHGTTIILTTHYLEEAEALCRNIAIIDHGRLLQNSSTRALLQQLQTETFVLDLAQPVPVAPELPGYPCRVNAEGALEVDVDKTAGLNPLFALLTDRGMTVMSLRNRANRLEELFLGLVQRGAGTA